MLRKKTTASFKPKIGIRRNAPGAPGRQSKTPAPAASSTPKSGPRPPTPATTVVPSAGSDKAVEGAAPAIADPISSAPSVPATAPPTTSSADPTPPTTAFQITPSPSIEPPTVDPSSKAASAAETTTHPTAPPPARQPAPNSTRVRDISSGWAAPAEIPPADEQSDPVTEPTTEPTTSEVRRSTPESSRSREEPSVPPIPSTEIRPTETASREVPSPSTVAQKDTAPSGSQGRKRKAPASKRAAESANDAHDKDASTASTAKKRRTTTTRDADNEASAASQSERRNLPATRCRTRQAVRQAASGEGRTTDSATETPAEAASGPKAENAAPSPEQGNAEAPTTQKKQTKARKTAARKKATRGATGEPNNDALAPRASRNRRGPADDANEADDAAGADAAEPSEDGSGDSADEAEPANAPKKKASKRPRRERSVTPEDAEERKIDPKIVTMRDLTKDLRLGKKFSRHDELRDRMKSLTAKQRLARKQRKEGTGSGSEENDEANGGESTPGAGGKDPSHKSTPGASGSSSAPDPPPALALTGPQFELVDGAIVVNQASLVHDRHAAAAAAHEDMEEVEENDFTRMTNSMTYLRPNKLRGPNSWSKEETEMFYTYLEMMGSDFSLLTPMFPGRTRRHLKMKFNREERHNLARVNAALLGPKRSKIDLAVYQSRTGTTLEATEAIEAEQRAREEAHEAEQRRIKEEAEKVQLEKRKRLLGTGDGNGDDDGPAAAAGDNEDDDDDDNDAEEADEEEEEEEEEEEGVEIIDEAEIVRPPPRRGARRAGGIGS